jgi:hypothetical protein
MPKEVFEALDDILKSFDELMTHHVDHLTNNGKWAEAQNMFKNYHLLRLWRNFTNHNWKLTSYDITQTYSDLWNAEKFWRSVSQCNPFIYVAGYSLNENDAPTDDLHKVGHTQNLHDRMQNLNSNRSFPRRLKLVHAIPTPKQHLKILEEHLHNELHSYRSHGEWFRIPRNELIAIVDKSVRDLKKATAI